MKFLRLVVLFIVIAVAANIATVMAMPWLISHAVMHRIVTTAVDHARQGRDNADPQQRQQARLIVRRGGYNVALRVPPVTAKSRTVVRPSPDLLYTACVFDLSQHALRIRAPVQASYVSVSGFSDDSSNFFAIDGQALPADASGERHFDLLLVHGEPTGQMPPGARIIHSSTTTGLVLFRSLIPNRKALPKLQQQYQAQQRCTPIAKGRG